MLRRIFWFCAGMITVLAATQGLLDAFQFSQESIPATLLCLGVSIPLLLLGVGLIYERAVKGPGAQKR